MREQRPAGGFSSGTDSFLMKGHDTFGPIGPFIVPKEFYGNPMTDLKQTLLVGTDQRQQSDASDMIHSVSQGPDFVDRLTRWKPRLLRRKDRIVSATRSSPPRRPIAAHGTLSQERR